MAKAFLAFGSNLGDREKNIRRAADELHTSGIKVLRMSSIIESKPEGGPPQDNYLNAVAMVMTGLPPEDLLAVLQNIELRLGRVRSVPNAARTIDLDILLYGNVRLNTDHLTIPHPRMLKRRFVMEPLAEIAPETVRELRHENTQDHPIDT